MFARLTLILIMLCGFLPHLSQAADDIAPKWPDYHQYSAFPRPLPEYRPATESGIMATLKSRIQQEPFNAVASVIFLLAIVHTFAAGPITKLSHKIKLEHRQKIRAQHESGHKPEVEQVSFKASILHFLGEIEAIFGIWSLALTVAAICFHSWEDWKLYLHKDRDFTEPLFVVVIMAIAASRPVLRFAEHLVANATKLRAQSPAAWWFSILTITPLLGSFITEPAAMTIGALLLLKKFYRHKPSSRFAYVTLGLLFVNVSIGGTLTHFAAPPVLMVARKWEWNTPFMMTHFGWKAVIAILISNLVLLFMFRKELLQMADAADGVVDGVIRPSAWHEREDHIPVWITAIHLAFLGWTVFTAHDPILFIGGFLFFLAFVSATNHHQNAISMKSPVLVGFFLASLIIHGGCQSWWIEPIIRSLGPISLKAGSTILTAFNDNAAITYLAAQVPNLAPDLQYAAVAGAVIGGGLTVIANAPNPAGQSILAKAFGGSISPGKLALAALPPTVIAFLAFSLLPNL